MLGIHHHRYRLAVICCSPVPLLPSGISNCFVGLSVWGLSFVCGAANAAYDEFSRTYSAAAAEFVTCFNIAETWWGNCKARTLWESKTK